MKDFRGRALSKRKKVVPFEREADYYLHKGMAYYQRNLLNKALIYFRKATEVDSKNPYNHYNLACLLSKLGRIREANTIFHLIVQKMDASLTECYFLLAINYGLLEDVDRSREYLYRYLEADPEGEMALEAAELLDALDGEPCYLPSYSEKDQELHKLLRKGDTEELKRLYSGNPRFRRALQNRLYRCSDEFKEEILHFYGKLGGAAASRVLHEYIKNPWIKERFRQLALLALKNLGETGTVQVFMDGEVRDVTLDEFPVKTPVWRQEWQNVIDCTIANMRRSQCYDEGFFEDVQAIWLDFINTVYPDVPPVKKGDTWAAALEYSLARFHFLCITQKALAEDYGVSAASVSNRFRVINAALNIDRKAYQNMMSYLKRER